jgi:hypothetical protein
MEKMAELDRGGQRHFLDSAEKLMKMQQETEKQQAASSIKQLQDNGEETALRY